MQAKEASADKIIGELQTKLAKALYEQGIPAGAARQNEAEEQRR